MSDEQKIATETIAVVAETVQEETAAPALPTSEPPKEETTAAPVEGAATTEEAAAPAEGETAPAGDENKEEKKPSRLKKRLTLKWGKNRDQAEAPKELEPPVDIKENALGWMQQQIPAAVHKVNYHVLEWVQNSAVEEEARQPLPGKDAMVTRNQFLAFLRDGDILNKLANKLQDGATEIATPEEGADAAKIKEVQTKNVDSFVGWAKDNLGLEESKAMTSADLLEKGKAGYPAVFETLWALGLKAQEKFQKDGIDVDAVVQAAGAVVRTNIITQILSFFRRTRRASTSEKKEEEKAAEEAEGAAVAAGADVPAVDAPEGEQVTEEECKKVDASAAAAVAAN